MRQRNILVAFLSIIQKLNYIILITAYRYQIFFAAPLMLANLSPKLILHQKTFVFLTQKQYFVHFIKW